MPGCPLGFGSWRGKPSGDAALKTAAASGVCPFGFRSNSSTGGATVPTSSGSPNSLATPTLSSQPSAEAVCPYGFSSAAGPKLSEFHCTLCKSFLYDAQKLQPCKHAFCKCCATRFQDCPACGCDIEGMESDASTQELVDQFLAAHIHIISQQVEVADKQEDTTQQDEAIKPAQPAQPAIALPDLSQLLPGAAGASHPAAATFLLRLGIQALKGGNPVAALDRLESCKQVLLSSTGVSPSSPAAAQTEHTLASSSDTGSPAAAATPSSSVSDASSPSQPSPSHSLQHTAKHSIVLPAHIAPPGDLGARIHTLPPAGPLSADVACMLGSVFGSQGDACKQLGSLEGAADLYACSVTCLQGAADAGHEEAAHAFTVSINKLGDVQYLLQDVASARQSYLKALGIRQKRLQASLPAAQLCPQTKSQDMQQVAAGLQPECVAQALDVVASLIKVADASACLEDQELTGSSCRDAQALLAACQEQLGRAAEGADAQQGQSDSPSSMSAEQQAQLLRCHQLATVLQQLQTSS